MLFSIASEASADGMSGKMLLGYCKALVGAFEKNKNAPLSEDELSSGGLCSGYIEGILDGSYYMRSIANNQFKSNYSTKAPLITDFWNVEIGSTPEVAKVIIKYLELHPERYNKPAVVAVYLALRERYPAE